MFGSPEDLHEVLGAIALGPGVPENIRTLFDTARNLSLCTWYVYEFHPIAELTGFLALEAALKERAKNVGSALANEKSFRRLMDHAIKVGWIAEERIAHRREIARARVEDRKALASIRRMDELGVDSIAVDEPTEDEIDAEARDMMILQDICKAAIDMRNGLAHGEIMLAPSSHRRLRMTADLINQIFSSEGPLAKDHMS
jgi:hypothetical protein